MLVYKSELGNPFSFKSPTAKMNFHISLNNESPKVYNEEPQYRNGLPLTLKDYYIKSYELRPLLQHIYANEVELSAEFKIKVSKRVNYVNWEFNSRRILNKKYKVGVENNKLTNLAQTKYKMTFKARLDSSAENSGKMVLSKNEFEYNDDLTLVFKCCREEPILEALDSDRSFKKRDTLTRYFTVHVLENEALVTAHVFKVNIRFPVTDEAPDDDDSDDDADEEEEASINIECEDESISVKTFVEVYEHLKSALTKGLNDRLLLAQDMVFPNYHCYLMDYPVPKEEDSVSEDWYQTDGIPALINWMAIAACNDYSDIRNETYDSIKTPYLEFNTTM
jgi:hypothetical protein